jgi:preprotein translocase subunit YajC
MMAALGLVAPLIAAGTTKKPSSSGSTTLLIFVVIAAAFYFLIYRPQQRKSKAAREMTAKFDVGDEVLTAGGIVGNIIDIDGDRYTLETSVGASFVVLKQYVIRRLDAPVPSVADDHDDEGDEHEHEDGDEEHQDGTEHDDAAGQANDDPTAVEDHDPGTDEDQTPPPTTRAKTRRANGRGKKSDDNEDPSGLDGPPII